MLSAEYIAGLFDGEGYVHIAKHKATGRHKFSGYQLSVNIVNTNLKILVECQKQFGGSICKHSKYLPNRKPCYHWRPPTKTAVKFLAFICPYLHIKQEQARLAIEFMATKTKVLRMRSGTPENEVSLREAYYQRMRSLNQK